MAPTEEEWEEHKDTIRSLFLQFSLTEVMKRMSRDYSFVASKTQYEKHFRNWRFRKNVKRTDGEWAYILNKKHQREQLGKTSEVLLYGVKITEKTIKKRESRYTISELHRIWDPPADAYPAIPEGISIRTPNMTPFARSPSPSLGFRSSESSLATKKDFVVSELRNEGDSWSTASLERYSTPKKITIQNLPYLQYLDFITQESNAVSRLFVSVFRCSEVVFDQDCMEIMQSPISLPYVPIVSDIDVCKILMSKSWFADYIISGSLEHQKMLRSHLHCTYLEKDVKSLDARIDRLFGPCDIESFLEFLGFSIYFSSNNMAGIRTTRLVLEWLLDQGRPILKRMLAIQLPSIQQFLGTMVEDMMEIRDINIGRALLEADTERRLFPGHPEKLLLAAVKSNYVELVKELLEKVVRNGIDINVAPYKMKRGKPVVQSNESIHGRLISEEVPITVLGTTDNVEIAGFLLESGADINALHYDNRDQMVTSPINKAARKGNLDLVRLFIHYNADLEEHSLASTTLFGALETRNFELVSVLLDGGSRSVDLLQVTNHRIDEHYFEDEKSFFELDGHMCRIKILATEFQLAVRMGHIDIITRLLKQTSHELKTGRHHWVPLRDAATSGNIEVVRLLVASGADVNASSSIDHMNLFCAENDTSLFTVRPFPSTPLLAAVEGGHIQVVEFLLGKEANINAVAFGKYGMSTLQAASNLNFHDISQLLRHRGAMEALPQTKEEMIIGLKLAARREDIETAKVLVKCGADPSWILDIFPYTSIGTRLNMLQTSLLTVFMAVCGENLNVRGPVTKSSPLKAAISVMAYKIALEIVYAFGIMVDDDLCTWYTWNVFISSSPTDYHNIIKLLLAMTEVTGNRIFHGHALQFAIAEMDWETIQHLVLLGADVNAESWDDIGNALLIALKYRTNTDACLVIRYLLSLGVDVNSRYGFDHSTPLQTAAANHIDLLPSQNKDVIQLLLERGARINDPAHKKWGRTALQAAASSRTPSFETIKLLLDNGADINASPAKRHSYTALQGAAMRGYLNIAHLLLEQGADPNAPSSPIGGRTALEGAAENGRLDMVQLLLDAGATVTDEVIELAELEGHTIIADLLRKESKA